MLFNFDKLVEKHNMVMTGVIHVGAHECGEILQYTQHKILNGILIEANPYRFNNLQNTLKTGVYPRECFPYVQYEKLPEGCATYSSCYEAYNYAVTDKDNEKIQLNLSTIDGGVDSIFKINQFGVESSWAPYQHVAQVEVNTITLDTLMRKHPEEYNFINLDVEGAELLVLKGAQDVLKNRIKYVMCETQEKSRFDGSCLANEITDFLAQFGFKLVDYYDTGKLWGDALYVKEPN